MSHGDASHRRDFVRALALGAVAAPAMAAEPVVAAPPIDEIDARMAIVIARFGKHARLDAAARSAIRAEIVGLIARGEALRKLPLHNGDGPFPVFHPYRSSSS
jgi:hypothetical protein